MTFGGENWTGSLWEIESDSSSISLSMTYLLGHFGCLTGIEDFASHFGFEGATGVDGMLRMAGHMNTLTKLPSMKVVLRTISTKMGLFLYGFESFQTRPGKSCFRAYNILLEYRSFALRV